MKKRVDVVRAWRDEEYRNSLSAEERAGLPENPAGLATISDETMRSITGGCGATAGAGSICTTAVHSCVTPPENCP